MDDIDEVNVWSKVNAIPKKVGSVINALKYTTSCLFFAISLLFPYPTCFEH